MTWLAVSSPHSNSNESEADVIREFQDASQDALMIRGSLVIELRLPNTQRPEPLVLFAQDGDWPTKLALRAVPAVV